MISFFEFFHILSEADQPQEQPESGLSAAEQFLKRWKAAKGQQAAAPAASATVPQIPPAQKALEQPGRATPERQPEKKKPAVPGQEPESLTVKGDTGNDPNEKHSGAHDIFKKLRDTGGSEERQRDQAARDQWWKQMDRRTPEQKAADAKKPTAEEPVAAVDDLEKILDTLARNPEVNVRPQEMASFGKVVNLILGRGPDGVIFEKKDPVPAAQFYKVIKAKTGADDAVIMKAIKALENSKEYSATAEFDSGQVPTLLARQTSGDQESDDVSVSFIVYPESTVGTDKYDDLETKHALQGGLFGQLVGDPGLNVHPRYKSGTNPLDAQGKLKPMLPGVERSALEAPEKSPEELDAERIKTVETERAKMKEQHYRLTDKMDKFMDLCRDIIDNVDEINPKERRTYIQAIEVALKQIDELVNGGGTKAGKQVAGYFPTIGNMIGNPKFRAANPEAVAELEAEQKDLMDIMNQAREMKSKAIAALGGGVSPAEKPTAAVSGEKPAESEETDPRVQKILQSLGDQDLEDYIIGSKDEIPHDVLRKLISLADKRKPKAEEPKVSNSVRAMLDKAEGRPSLKDTNVWYRKQK